MSRSYEFRRLRPDDLEQVWLLDAQVFNSDPAHREGFLSLADPERFQGAFHRGRLAAMANALPFGQFFGGRRVAMGGLCSVAVAPEDRGCGLAVLVCRASLRDMHERGESISTLFPGTTSLYRKLGWELAGAFVIRHIEARILRTLPLPAAGRIRRATPEDLPVMKELYERLAPRTNGFLDRCRNSWYFAEERWDSYYTYLALDADGEPSGYVVYEQLPPLPDRFGYTVKVRDLVALDRDALSSLHWLLGSSSTQAAVVEYRSSPEDVLSLVLGEQEERVHGDLRWMVRVVDAPLAVSQRGYPAGLELEVPLVLSERAACRDDAPLAANAGAFTLLISKGEGRLERRRSADAAAPTIEIGGFASLYTGWAQSTTLERAGLLVGGTPEARALLDAAFGGPTPWLPEEF
jgi:predicted acetyltransferase